MIFRPRFPIVFSVIALALLIAGLFLLQYTVKRLNEREQTAERQQREDVQITIVEGKRREEIAAQLEEAGITSATSFLTATEGLEGRLFPDTYRFFPDTSSSDVVSVLLNTYQTRTAGLSISSEDLVLASIVEREAQSDSERAVIAGVYANRLARGMKLDADPTVQYGKDTLAYQDAGRPLSFSFWGPITQADYSAVASSYNTYQNAGLPPTAICNPGLKSIQAALNPEKHSYFFFFHANGQIYLSKTFSEHTQKLRLYR